MRAALRDAALTGAVAGLVGWDDCLMPDAAGNTALADLLALIDHHRQLVVIAGQSAWQARGSERARHLIWLDFPVPDYAHRHKLWSHFISRCGVTAPADFDLADLAGQFSLTAAQIHDAVAAAADQARLRGDTLDKHELFIAARSYSSPGLANLAHKIEACYTWDAIVLPTDQLAMMKETIATVRGRHR